MLDPLARDLDPHQHLAMIAVLNFHRTLAERSPEERVIAGGDEVRFPAVLAVNSGLHAFLSYLGPLDLHFLFAFGFRPNRFSFVTLSRGPFRAEWMIQRDVFPPA